MFLPPWPELALTRNALNIKLATKKTCTVTTWLAHHDRCHPHTLRSLPLRTLARQHCMCKKLMGCCAQLVQPYRATTSGTGLCSSHHGSHLLPSLVSIPTGPILTAHISSKRLLRKASNQLHGMLPKADCPQNATGGTHLYPMPSINLGCTPTAAIWHRPTNCCPTSMPGGWPKKGVQTAQPR